MRVFCIIVAAAILHVPILPRMAEAGIRHAVGMSGPVNISGGLDYLEDREGRLRIDDITGGHAEWKSHGMSRVNFGYSPSSFWFRFTPPLPAEGAAYCEIDNPGIDHIEFYIPDGQGNFKAFTAGDTHPFAQRIIRDPNFIFPLKGSPPGKACYFMIKGRGRLMFIANLWGEKDIFTRSEKRVALSWLYYGVMLVMLLFNLFVFFSIREKSYLFLVFIIAGWLMAQFANEGYAFQYLWPDSIGWNGRSLPFFISIIGISSGFFIQSFIATAKNFPIAHRLIYLNITVYLGFLAFIIVGVSDILRYLLVFVIYVVLINLSISIYGVVKKNRQARFLLIAFSINFIVNIMSSLEIIHVISSNIAPIGTKLSTSTMILLLTIGLADRINIMRNRLQISEDMVLQQNQDLSAANEELQAANEELEAQNEELIETQLELEKNEKQLQSSLTEKEVLIQEIHHRVKNNMQIISSLMSLQADNVVDEKDREIFANSQGRIRSMAMIHEMLYQSENLSEINFKEYVSALIEELFRNFYIDKGHIHMAIEITDISLNIDNAIPCGLIINELVSNAIKYAFPSGSDGVISIEFFRNRDGLHTLIISDSGIGLPSEMNLDESGTLGLELVNALVKQLKGSIVLDIDKGTKFTITFKPHKRDLKYP